jgi:hypothetical protein
MNGMKSRMLLSNATIVILQVNACMVREEKYGKIVEDT